MTANVYGATLAALLDWINVQDPPYDAKGDGATDDTAAIQAALNAAPVGGTVYLPPPPVSYATSAPLTIPPQVRLLGPAGTHIDATTCSIKPLASFAGAAVLLLVDQATGGYSLPNTDAKIQNLTLDGSALTGTTIDGIQAQGYVHGVQLDNVQIRSMPNHGIGIVTNSSGTAYSWRGTRIVANACGGYGLNVGLTDSTWIDLESIGCGKSGYFLGSSANTHFTNCRAEWNGQDGFTITGTQGGGTGSGGATFVGCSTDRNAFNGVSVTSTGAAPLIFTGLTLRRDGRSSTSAGYAGFSVSAGATTPVIVNGAAVYPGTDDNGSGNASPQYGFSITGSSKNVALNAGFFQGISAGVHDDGTNTNWWRSPNILEATGPTSGQTFAAAYNWTTSGQGTISQAADAIALQLSNSATNVNNALLNYVSGGAAGVAVKSRASADSSSRFVRDVSGKMQWGPGNATVDTDLYRSAAGLLQTDNNLKVAGTLEVDSQTTLIGSSTGSTGLVVSVGGDTTGRIAITSGGTVNLSSGSAAADTNLYRASAGVLATDNSLVVGGHALGMSHPREHGAIAWTMDPTLVNGGNTMTGGTVYLSAVYVNRAVSASKIYWGTTTAGASPTSGQNWIGLYSSAGSLLTSVGIDGRVTSANGLWGETISASLTPGMYWVGWVFNAGTTPTVLRGPAINGTLVNFNLAASSYRFATNAASQTTLPATITPSSNAAGSASFWAAIA